LNQDRRAIAYVTGNDVIGQGRASNVAQRGIYGVDEIQRRVRIMPISE
jgi:hypothetical protein